MNDFKLTRNEEMVLMLHFKFRSDDPSISFTDCDGFCIVRKTNCIRIYTGGKRGKVITEILFN